MSSEESRPATHTREAIPKRSRRGSRIHFEHAFTRRDDYERLTARMRTGFIRQGNDGIVKARAVEDRLMADTWQQSGYDLLPKLQALQIPTLVLVGEDDFIPPEIAEHIAHAIPNSQFVKLKGCGHFAFMECAEAVQEAVKGLVSRRGGRLVN